MPAPGEQTRGARDFLPALPPGKIKHAIRSAAQPDRKLVNVLDTDKLFGRAAWVIVDAQLGLLMLGRKSAAKAAAQSENNEKQSPTCHGYLLDSACRTQTTLLQSGAFEWFFSNIDSPDDGEETKKLTALSGLAIALTPHSETTDPKSICAFTTLESG